jgi:hypothetical protein
LPGPAAIGGFTDTGRGIKWNFQSNAAPALTSGKAKSGIALKLHLWVVNRFRPANVKPIDSFC